MLTWAEDALTSGDIPDAERETLFMASVILGCKPLEIYLKRTDVLDDHVITRFKDAVKRRLTREPGQYISGVQEFYGLEFKVNASVLIPRPETEGLIDLTLKGTHSAKNLSPILLDVGTGSGCIAVTLAHELPGARVVATDISEPSLKTASENAQKLGVSERVFFVRSDLFDAISPHSPDGGFDIIVSNPPYVTLKEFNALEPEVRVYEPEVALLGGVDGLDFYRRIAKDAPSYLKPGGKLLLEVGYGQAEDVISLLKDTGVFTSTGSVPDLYGVERHVWAVKG